MAAHPLITDDTGTQGRGKFQLELNGEISHDKETTDGVEVRERAAKVAAALSAGITEDIDIVIGFPWQWSRVKQDGIVAADNNGPGDTSLEAEMALFQTGGLLSAVKPGMTFPSGNENRGLGNGKVSYGVTLIATQEWERFFVHANAAYTHNEFKLDIDKDANRRDIWHGSIAGGMEVVKDLRVVANIGLETNGDHGSNTWPAFILGGVIYSVNENLDLDFGVKGGLNRPEPDVTALAGLAWRF